MQRLILISLITFGLVFSPLIGISAQETGNLYGEVFYTTFADEELEIVEEDFELDLSSGFGINVGGEMTIVPEFGFSAEFSRFVATDSFSESIEEQGQQAELNVDADIPVNAVSGNAVFNLYNFLQEETLPEIKLIGGAGYYFGEYNWNFETTINGQTVYEESESIDISGIGMKAKVSVAQEIAENFSIKGNIGYRVLDLENGNGDDVDFNGLKIGGGVVYSF